MMKSKKIHQDVYASIVIYLVLLFLFVVALKLPENSAIFPNMLIAAITILNTIVLFNGIKKTKSMREENSTAEDSIKFEAMKKPLIVFLLSVIYIILFAFTNYFIATGIFMVALMRFYKIASWKKIILIILVYNIIIYFGFSKLLNVPLV